MYIGPTRMQLCNCVTCVVFLVMMKSQKSAAGLCERVRLSGTFYQTSREGTYSSYTRNCSNRPTWFQDGPASANYIYCMDNSLPGFKGWMIGTEFCTNRGGLAVSTDAQYPYDVLPTEVWLEVYRMTWLANNNIAVKCDYSSSTPPTEQLGMLSAGAAVGITSAALTVITCVVVVAVCYCAHVNNKRNSVWSEGVSHDTHQYRSRHVEEHVVYNTGIEEHYTSRPHQHRHTQHVSVRPPPLPPGGLILAAPAYDDLYGPPPPAYDVTVLPRNESAAQDTGNRPIHVMSADVAPTYSTTSRLAWQAPPSDDVSESAQSTTSSGVPVYSADSTSTPWQAPPVHGVADSARSTTSSGVPVYGADSTSVPEPPPYDDGTLQNLASYDVTNHVTHVVHEPQHRETSHQE